MNIRTETSKLPFFSKSVEKKITSPAFLNQPKYDFSSRFTPHKIMAALTTNP